MINLTISIAGLEAASDRLDALANFDATKAMRKASLVMRDKVVETFRSETDPWGQPWPPLAESTLKARERSGNTSQQKLVDSADMYATLDNSSDATSATVSIGGGLPDDRAAANQFGTTTAPARPMFPLRTPAADVDAGSLPADYIDEITQPIIDALIAEWMK